MKIISLLKRYDMKIISLRYDMKIISLLKRYDIEIISLRYDIKIISLLIKVWYWDYFPKVWYRDFFPIKKRYDVEIISLRYDIEIFSLLKKGMILRLFRDSRIYSRLVKCKERETFSTFMLKCVKMNIVWFKMKCSQCWTIRFKMKWQIVEQLDLRWKDRLLNS